MKSGSIHRSEKPAGEYRKIVCNSYLNIECRWTVWAGCTGSNIVTLRPNLKNQWYQDSGDQRIAQFGRPVEAEVQTIPNLAPMIQPALFPSDTYRHLYFTRAARLNPTTYHLPGR